MSLAEMPQLQNLTSIEKLELISELWDSLDEQTVQEQLIPEEEKAILDARLAEHEVNPGSALSEDEFWRRYSERLGKHL